MGFKRNIASTLCAVVMATAASPAYAAPPKDTRVKSQYGIELSKRHFTLFGVEWGKDISDISLHVRRSSGKTYTLEAEVHVPMGFFASYAEEQIIETTGIYGSKESRVRPLVEDIFKNLRKVDESTVLVRYTVGKKYGYINTYMGHDSNKKPAGAHRIPGDMAVGLLHYIDARYLWHAYDKTALRSEYSISKTCGEECREAIKENDELGKNKVPRSKRIYEGDRVILRRR